MLLASIPSSCVALDQVPSLAEPQFLLQHRLAVLGEARLGWGGVGGSGSSGLQPWGQHPISTERESLSLYNGRWKKRVEETPAGLPPHPGVKLAVYQLDLLSPT